MSSCLFNSHGMRGCLSNRHGSLQHDMLPLQGGGGRDKPYCSANMRQLIKLSAGDVLRRRVPWFNSTAQCHCYSWTEIGLVEQIKALLQGCRSKFRLKSLLTCHSFTFLALVYMTFCASPAPACHDLTSGSAAIRQELIHHQEAVVRKAPSYLLLLLLQHYILGGGAAPGWWRGSSWAFRRTHGKGSMLHLLSLAEVS